MGISAGRVDRDRVAASEALASTYGAAAAAAAFHWAQERGYDAETG